MKCAILFLAAIGAAYAAPSAELVKDFRDFFMVIPTAKIRQLALDHLDNDQEFQAAVKYLQTKEHKTMVKNLHHKPSVKEMRKIVIDAGLDLELFEGIINAFLESLYIVVPENQKRSFGKFLGELNDLIPYEKLADLLADKLEDSPAFKRFFDAVSSDRMHTLFDKALRSEEFRVLSKEIISMDVPIDDIIDAIYALFEWKSFDETPNDLPE